MQNNKVLLAVVALFIPPLAVYLKDGSITNNFWINLALTILGFGVAGILHALYIIFK
jgi:uncharacterized membrane protein YqaE (UPF0057 family)